MPLPPPAAFMPALLGSPRLRGAYGRPDESHYVKLRSMMFKNSSAKSSIIADSTLMRLLKKL